MSRWLGGILLHIPVGGYNFWLLREYGPVAAALFAFFFWYYESNEDRHTNDQAWYDIAGWLWGFAVAALIGCIL